MFEAEKGNVNKFTTIVTNKPENLNYAGVNANRHPAYNNPLYPNTYLALNAYSSTATHAIQQQQRTPVPPETDSSTFGPSISSF